MTIVEKFNLGDLIERQPVLATSIMLVALSLVIFALVRHRLKKWNSAKKHNP